MLCRAEPETETSVSPRRGEVCENAKLIAAAPDLYEALENLLTKHVGVTVLEWMSSDENGNPKAITHPLCDAARAALAKSRGEQ